MKQIEQAILQSVAEPKSVPELVTKLQQDGHTEADIRRTVWNMADPEYKNDVVFRKDWKVQAGEHHTKQLFLPGMDEDSKTVFEARTSSNG